MKKNSKKTPKNLTRRESIFLEHIATGMNISKAARAAGYSRKWPGQAGSQAFKNIQRKRPTILHELGLTVDAIMEYAKAHQEEDI
jgi:phage terminase small subunit